MKLMTSHKSSIYSKYDLSTSQVIWNRAGFFVITIFLSVRFEGLRLAAARQIYFFINLWFRDEQLSFQIVSIQQQQKRNNILVHKFENK